MLRRQQVEAVGHVDTFARLGVGGRGPDDIPVGPDLADGGAAGKLIQK